MHANGNGNGVSSEMTINVQSKIPGSTRLRQMLANSDHIIECPGVYDGLSARIAIDLGFEAMYMTGAGTTASRLGQPDLGIAHLSDMKAHADMIANLDRSVPLIADMDTGYGGPIIIERSVTEYARAGVAAFHIEDQIAEKRCGHLTGKQVVDLDTYASRIRAANLARERIGSDIIIIGRTDAFQKHGYEECIKRLRLARDLGADLGIFEGMNSKEMARQAVIDCAPMPLVLNMVENGAMPLIPAKEAQEMGYRAIIFSFACLAPAYMSIRQALKTLKAQGYTGAPKDLTPMKMFEVCGLHDAMEIDKACGGKREAV